MGYDIHRFVDAVDDEYFCSICLSVFENPVHGPCGHTFCSVCIENWIGVTMNVNTCPLDKKTLYKKDLTQVSLPFRNLLTRLRIKCDFEPAGCTYVCQMAVLPDHVKICPFNPNGEMVCESGCDLTFLRKDKDQHKCIQALKELVAKQRVEIADLTRRIPKRTYPESMVMSHSSRVGLSSLVNEREMLDQMREQVMRRRIRDARARTPDGSEHRTPLSRLMSSGLHTSGDINSSHRVASLQARSPSGRVIHSFSEFPSVEVRLQRLSEEELAPYGIREPNGSASVNGGRQQITSRSLRSDGDLIVNSSSQTGSNGLNGSNVTSSQSVGSSSGNGSSPPSSGGSSSSGSRYDLLSAMLSSRLDTRTTSLGCGPSSSSSSRD